MKYSHSKFVLANMKTIFSGTLFAILTYAHANSIEFMNCKNVKRMENFDSAKYFTGTWYVTHAQLGSESIVCRKFTYNLKQDGTLEVNVIRYIKNGENDYFYIDSCHGSEKSDEKGKYSAECTREYEGEGKANELFHVERTVIKTDYNSYAVVYTCRSGNKDDIWVLHRNKDNEVSQVSEILKENGWTLTDFRSRKNFECKERPDS